MTSLLSTHLSQISLCATSIASLPFPGPKIFTNALLSPTHDITSLIRDTEQHERALFHLAAPPLPAKSGAAAGEFGVSLGGGVGGNVGGGMGGSTAGAGAAAKRRATQFAAGGRPARNKAVAAVLGGDLYRRTRGVEDHQQLQLQQQGGGSRQLKAGELDVEVLLLGAEKLAGVYPIPGAQEKITALRRRHQQLEANLAHYEARVAEQIRELQAMNRPRNGTGDDEEVEDTRGVERHAIPLTIEDLRKEEEEVRELERKKRGLEERVEGMDRDLGGLMR